MANSGCGSIDSAPLTDDRIASYKHTVHMQYYHDCNRSVAGHLGFATYFPGPDCIQYALFPCVQVISTQTLVDPSQVASFACNSLVTSLVESNLLLSRIQVLYTPVLTRELTHKSTRLFDERMNAD
jgi:hypothetical protein